MLGSFTIKLSAVISGVLGLLCGLLVGLVETAYPAPALLEPSDQTLLTFLGVDSFFAAAYVLSRDSLRFPSSEVVLHAVMLV